MGPRTAPRRARHECPLSAASRPGRPKCAAASHFQQKSWDTEIGYTPRRSHLVEKFWSEVRCRGVVLRASRISVCPRAGLSLAMHTLFTPNGAQHGLISRICLLPFTGANTGACPRMGMHSYLSTLHLVSHTDALYTRSPLRVPTRAGGPYRKHAPLQRTARPSDALPAAVRPRRRLSCTLACHYQVTSAQSKPAPAAVAATPAWQLEEGRNVEMTGCTSEPAAQHHRGGINSARRGNSCHPPLAMPAASSHAVHFGGLQKSSRHF